MWMWEWVWVWDLWACACYLLQVAAQRNPSGTVWVYMWMWEWEWVLVWGLWACAGYLLQVAAQRQQERNSVGIYVDVGVGVGACGRV